MGLSEGGNETGLGISCGSPNLPSGTLFSIYFFIFVSASPCWRLPMIGVSIWPGLRTFTRMRRSRRSFVQVLANERTAAFVALYTLMAGKPLISPIDPDRMIAPPPPPQKEAFLHREEESPAVFLEVKGQKILLPSPEHRQLRQTRTSQ